MTPPADSVMLLPPNIQETQKALRRNRLLKNNKTPGTNGITAVLVKSGGARLENEIHQIVTEVWIDDSLPCDWKLDIIYNHIQEGRQVWLQQLQGYYGVEYRLYEILPDPSGSSSPLRRRDNRKLSKRIPKRKINHSSDLHQAADLGEDGWIQTRHVPSLHRHQSCKWYYSQGKTIRRYELLATWINGRPFLYFEIAKIYLTLSSGLQNWMCLWEENKGKRDRV